jgi:hypothetical protein
MWSMLKISFFINIFFSSSNSCKKNSTWQNICHSFLFFFSFTMQNQRKTSEEKKKERIKCCYSPISNLSLSPITCCSLELMHTRDCEREQWTFTFFLFFTYFILYSRYIYGINAYSIKVQFYRHYAIIIFIFSK